MILTNRLFTRKAPTRDAKSIYIFCEGAKREYQYFDYFKEIDSRINIEIYQLSPLENNSPLGLYNIAHRCIIKSEENPNPKFEFLKNDQVWIVLDTDLDKLDSRKPQIEKLRTDCKKHSDWFVAQSNPCFEVWLYNHFFDQKPFGQDLANSKLWKEILNETIPGGFNSKKHPIYIEKAISNSQIDFNEIDEMPAVACTQVFKLAKVIYPLIEEKIKTVLTQL